MIKNKELTEEEIIRDKLPKKIYIKFEKGNSKADIKATTDYIYSYVSSNFSTNNDSYYKIIKIKDHDFFPDGHAFEIQEGGQRESYLEGIIEAFNDKDKDTITLNTREKQASIQRIYENINTYSLTESSNEKVDDIKTTKTLKPLVKNGYAVMFTGLIILSLSIISLFLSCLFKYVLFDKQEDYINSKSSTIIPLLEIKRNWVSNFDSEAISVQFNSKLKIWEIKKKSYNYYKNEETGLWVEGHITYSTEKINNTIKLNKIISQNERKRKASENKKDGA